jgi:hypothetical protein
MTASNPPPSPAALPQARPHRSRRSSTLLLVTLAVVGALTVAGVVVLLTRSPGPPGTPGTPRATATTCGDPCTEIQPRVEVTWTAPSDGGEVTGYRVQRDGEPLPGADALDPATHVLIDGSVELGRTYTYRIIAFGEEGSSPPSSEVTAEIGLPANDLAQLDGVYDVHLKVRSARSLAAMLGIDQPVPGTRDTDEWTFESTCSPSDTACPTTWEGQGGVLRPDGRRWRGSISGPDARCGGGTRVSAPIAFDLRTLEAAVEGAIWRVRSFTGTVSIRFVCPGFGTSTGTLEVTGLSG